MHELGMCEAVLDTVQRRAAGRDVTRVRLRIGVLHRVVPLAFDQAFEMVSMGTVAEGAAVEIVPVPARVTCGDCGKETEHDEPETACGSCGSVRVEITDGDELTLESLQFSATTGEEESRASETAVPE